jgi:hypothetical protein
MSLKLMRFLVMSAVVLAACPLYFPGESLFGPVGPVTYSGVEPLAANSVYIPGQPDIVNQSTVDMRINKSGISPAGGAGMQWTWKF